MSAWVSDGLRRVHQLKNSVTGKTRGGEAFEGHSTHPRRANSSDPDADANEPDTSRERRTCRRGPRTFRGGLCAPARAAMRPWPAGKTPPRRKRPRREPRTADVPTRAANV